MGDKTGIEWTDATWNPVVGCSLVSPGCTNCYAMKWAAARMDQPHNQFPHYRGTTKSVNGKAVWTGKVAMAPDHILTAPLRWEKPRRIFVNSMGDLFHESVPDEWIDKVFAVMMLSKRHNYQILTKRSRRMRDYMSALAAEFESNKASGGNNRKWFGRGFSWPLDNSWQWPLPNVWLGVSAEDQARADERIPDLLDTPAAIRFVSAEPLLGPIDFTVLHHDGVTNIDALRGTHGLTSKEPCARLDWIIVGGESGPGARPMHPDWARAIRDQCAAAGVPFFFKQWGEWTPYKPQAGGDLGGEVRRDVVRVVHPSGRDGVELADASGGRTTEPGSRYMKRVGKKRAGALLDGRKHNDMPAKGGA